jgi:signal transduction histidine kinase/DNA-binding response OmpR family regulator
MLNNNKSNILIIDNNTEFGSQMYALLREYNYIVMQVLDKTEAIKKIQTSNNKIDLVLINTDILGFQEIYNFIKDSTQIKMILLSENDIVEKREEFFLQGILDYYVTTTKIEHVVDDIVETINSLETNKKETILIIDNSKKLCESLEKILEIRNYKVFTATSAHEGLELLKKLEITLLVLDMELTDINSLDLLEGLRDIYLLNQFFVLAISNKNNPSSVRDALKSGVKNFLKKPFYYEEFLLKIDILAISSRSKKTIIEQSRQIENNLKSFKELLDASIGAMFIFEKNSCINCNNEAISLLGFRTKMDILEKDIYDLFPDISQKHKKDLISVDINHNFEDTIISCNKIEYQVQFKERNILIDNKNIKIVAVMDITDLKSKEKILAHQSKMASMGTMIANIAHQWRQPLTSISIAASGIKLNYELEIEDKNETIEELDNIVENTKFLSETIESFQNFLNIDKNITTFNLIKTLQKTLSIIGANLNDNNIQIIQNYTDDYTIMGIENELIQVFLNIINNAADVLKNTSELKNNKYIFLSIKKENKHIIISIQDNAKGVPPNIIEKIFEPYFTTKHQAQGTGLGLYMTHQILEKMGASIKVINEEFFYENRTYYGANFQISFPNVYGL